METLVILHRSNSQGQMSDTGQKRTSQQISGMSALPPKADIRRRGYHVRFVPKPEVGHYSTMRVTTVLAPKIEAILSLI
jgi:hypothetical protein